MGESLTGLYLGHGTVQDKFVKEFKMEDMMEKSPELRAKQKKLGNMLNKRKSIINKLSFNYIENNNNNEPKQMR